jgi:low temperature requirement protein LtrA
VTGIAARRIHDAGQARHATWLELFFDLVVVVAVSRLGVRLHGDHSASGVAAFSGLLVVIWWIWISFSYFADLFDDDRVLDRTAQLLAMVGVAVAALALPGSGTAPPEVFAAANAALFGLLAALYVHAGRGEPRARELCRWYTVGSLTGMGLWLVSLALGPPARYLAWGLAVTANAVISGPLAYARMRHPPVQVSHMPERFGLFVLVVLGESILAVVNGVAHVHFGGDAVLIGLAGFLIAACLWWVYFDGFDEAAINRAIAGGSRAQVRSFLYGYGHLLIYAAIVVTGVGIQLAIEETARAGEPVPLIGLGVAAVVAGFFITSVGIGRRATPLLASVKLAIAALGLGLAVAGVPPLATTLTLAAALFLLVVLEWRRAPERGYL